MGTWQAGKSMWVGIEDAETIKAIRAAFEAGITTVDTAEVYGNGHSEQVVAQALSDVRDQVTYASKVFANHLKYDQVIEACEGSFAIAGARNASQASQNAKAADVKLSADELQEIDAIGRRVTDHLDENPVMWDWDS
jgi:aryl-alcohol dehydrogenase-like predicted oxidoreductase